jgi:predicted protein tyrosine phosphatase
MVVDGNILILCSGNKDRSPTAEIILSRNFHNVKSAGTNISYCKKNNTTPVDKLLVDQADLILCMEEKHFSLIKKWTKRSKVVVLDVPDKFEFDSKELHDVLDAKLSFLLA